MLPINPPPPPALAAAPPLISGWPSTLSADAFTVFTAFVKVRAAPASVAASYWQLYQQPKSAWTFELEIRPFGEKW